jgi:CRISPR system Cascade subunit CasB
MTTSTGSAPARPGLGPVGTAVDQTIRTYQRGYLDDQGFAVATVARLRRGVGKLSEDLPELWGLTGLEAIFQSPGIPDQDRERAADAAHVAVTLWALHQQSNHQTRMHTATGRDLGEAVRRLMPPGDLDEPIRRRFVQAGTATSLPALAERLRDLVVLLRREEIALDYGVLADQIFQSWGRSFHAHRPRTTGDPNTPTTSPAGSAADDTDTDKDLT